MSVQTPVARSAGDAFTVSPNGARIAFSRRVRLLNGQGWVRAGKDRARDGQIGMALSGSMNKPTTITREEEGAAGQNCGFRTANIVGSIPLDVRTILLVGLGSP